jgi:hypothetical protein
MTKAMISMISVVLWITVYGSFFCVVSLAKVLVLMVDSRRAGSGDRTSYMTYTIPINFAYARRHNYDFFLATYETTGLEEEVTARYGSDLSTPIEVSNKTKTAKAVFHPGLRQYRSTPWARIPILWDIAMNGIDGTWYDHIFYLDSDACINPRFQNISVHALLKYWSGMNVT